MTRMLWVLCLVVACGAPPDDDPDRDGDGALNDVDCHPDEADTYPGAPDPYGDAIDQDCDGMDGVDLDADGYPANVRTHPEHWRRWDCDDADAAIHPAAADLAGDAIDSNCDEADGVDADRDGYASIASGGDDCDDAESAISPGEIDLVGDDRDRDCDGVDGEDDDRDGWASSDSGGTDCDDTDPGIHPGAFDACDGVHSDCQTAPAELDQDGDGWMPCEGDCADSDPARYPGAPESCDSGDLNCDGVSGSTDADGDGVTGCAGDCDDSNPAVYPGAAEICDGLDTDCSGAPASSELDGDGDGYTGCAGDCEPGDPAIHPGAWDGPGGADADCDGSADTASLGWLQVTDSSELDAFGAAVAGGDFDGDGLVDLAVAAPGGNAVGSFSDGRVYIFHGTTVAAGGALTPTSADKVLEGENPLDFAGAALAAGDFDDDGLTDLAVGAFGSDGAGQNAGRVYVVSGGVLAGSGLSSLASAGLILDGVGLDAQAGEALAAGDVNGDGRADLVIGSSGTTGSGAWTGSAYVLYGPLSAGSLASADVTLNGPSDGSFAGASVGAGDLDGDGRADVLVGVPGGDAGYIHSGAGLGSGSATGGDWSFSRSLLGERGGLIGDLDGDGRAEVLLGNNDDLWIWRSATLGAQADYSLPGALGAAAGSDGDGDGRADLLVAWPGSTSIYLSSTLLPAATLAPGGDLDVTSGGAGVAGPGDLTGDGVGDFVVGGPGSAGVWPGF